MISRTPAWILLTALTLTTSGGPVTVTGSDATPTIPIFAVPAATTSPPDPTTTADTATADPVPVTRGRPVRMVPLYPWGTDHNGTARMDAAQVRTEGGVTTITAVRDLTQTPAVSSFTNKGEPIPVHYRSGAVHSASPIVIEARRTEIAVEARFPSEKGTWPAVWLTGVATWPPEIDVAEYMGSARVLQNVFAMSGRNSEHVPTRVDDPGAWHTYRAVLTPTTARDVLVQFSLDGRPTGSVVGTGLIGQKMWLIVNLQTEMWSGSPGPDRAELSFRNLTVS